MPSLQAPVFDLSMLKFNLKDDCLLPPTCLQIYSGVSG